MLQASLVTCVTVSNFLTMFPSDVACLKQISMSVLMGAMDVVVMQTVLILMVVTGVSVCQDSMEMD